MAAVIGQGRAGSAVRDEVPKEPVRGDVSEWNSKVIQSYGEEYVRECVEPRRTKSWAIPKEQGPNKQCLLDTSVIFVLYVCERRGVMLRVGDLVVLGALVVLGCCGVTVAMPGRRCGVGSYRAGGAHGQCVACPTELCASASEYPSDCVLHETADTWSRFKQTYDKTYGSPGEEQCRFAIFCANIHRKTQCEIAQLIGAAMDRLPEELSNGGHGPAEVSAAAASCQLDEFYEPDVGGCGKCDNGVRTKLGGGLPTPTEYAEMFSGAAARECSPPNYAEVELFWAKFKHAYRTDCEPGSALDQCRFAVFSRNVGLAGSYFAAQDVVSAIFGITIFSNLTAGEFLHSTPLLPF